MEVGLFIRMFVPIKVLEESEYHMNTTCKIDGQTLVLEVAGYSDFHRLLCCHVNHIVTRYCAANLTQNYSLDKLYSTVS